MFVFIETKLFTRLVSENLTDEDYQSLQQTLLNNPEAGAVIPLSGGVRKLRWRAAGRGKRGGYRVIYFARTPANEIWFITIYPKNVKDTIPAAMLKKIRKEIEGDKTPKHR